ncbi:nucleoside 2-deoxyribosyltransferase [Lysinibacillus telephonicus]|uniref:nucleoside 2-deoxyribosyltransferase n=1 Tax=Lysinibacillus telephonicus TaxID=1714840 RepID=UPI003BA093B2
MENIGKREVGRINEREFPELKLSWDNRQNVNIYLAGPDFPRYDTSLFDEIEQSLKLYNLSPHRPIKENGLFTGNETYEIRQAMYDKDVELLKKCDFMIAILIDDDPGTFVEIG